MAIKVNGTTVVDDSRNLTNIASIDATTGAAISAGISTTPPTTAGAVGTYVYAFDSVARQLTFGSTYAGSQLYPASFVSTGNAPIALESGTYLSTGSGTLSGTWRAMGAHYNNSTFKNATVYVRIS